MVRVRKLVLAIAAASALTSGMAHALGLGEISLKSALNQPLDAEIELLEVRDLGDGEVLPTLAAVEEFNKVGVDRPYFLTDLKFTPVLKPNGKSVIRVTSSKPVREPYLNFLVEVLWPNGRLLREYTVLLDPPLYSPQTVAAAAPRLPQAAPLVQRAATPAPAARQPAPTPVAAAPSAAPSRIEGDQYRVGRDDTLWQIAERVRPSNALSVHQTMLALQDLNPDAFLGGNINRLKSGQVLRVPSEEQIRSRSQADALAQVAAQNSAWREGRAVQPVAAARQLDATRRSEAGSAPAQAVVEDNLRLVSAASGKATSGSDSGAAADSQGLADQLALSQEGLATAQRENQELKERLGDLQSQLDKLQRLIELKNEQLAKLQGGLAADAEVLAAAEQAAPGGAHAGAGEVAGESPLEAAPEAGSTTATSEAATTTDTREAEAAAPAVAASQPAPAVVTETAKPAVAEAAKPAARPVAPVPVYEPSLVDEVLANPLLLAAGGGALALLAGLGLLSSRRRARKQAEEAGLFQDPLASDAGSDAQPSVAPAALAGSAVAAAALAAGAQASADPLAEAETYTTYGRFTQAAEVLVNAVNDEPQRIDLRLKLMEVYAEMGDREGFVRQEVELGELGGAQPQIDQLRARYPHVLAAGASAAVAVDSLDLSLDTPMDVQADLAANPVGEAADALSFDDLSFDDLGLDDQPSAPAQAEGSALSAQGDAFDLSLDDLEAELEREMAANPASASEQPLELDELSLDGLADDLLDLEAQAPAQAAAPQAAAEQDLDLQLDALELPALEGLESQGAADSLTLDDEFALALEESLADPARASDGGLEDVDLFAELDQLSLDEPQQAAADSLAGGDALLAELEALELQPATVTPAPADELLAELDGLELQGAAEMPGAVDELQAELDALELQPLDAPAAAELLGELDGLELQGAGETAGAADELMAELDELELQPVAAATDPLLSELDDLQLDMVAPLDETEQGLDAAFEELLAQPEHAASAAPIDEPAALEVLSVEPELTGNEDFNFLADTDEAATKLDLAQAYIDMGDADGARDILDEVLKEGSDSQQQRAREMMGRIA